MKPSDDKKIKTLLTEIRIIAKDLPPGKARKVANRCDKITMVLRKTN